MNAIGHSEGHLRASVHRMYSMVGDT